MQFLSGCEDKATIIETGPTISVLENAFIENRYRWIPLVKKNKPAEEAEGYFIVDFGCEKQRNLLEMYNAHRDKGDGNVQGTKDFKLHLFVSGEWREVVNGILHNGETRNMQTFSFDSTLTRKVKFEAWSSYGKGPGLMYFNVGFAGEFQSESFHVLIIS